MKYVGYRIAKIYRLPYQEIGAVDFNDSVFECDSVRSLVVRSSKNINNESNPNLFLLNLLVLKHLHRQYSSLVRTTHNIILPMVHT